LTSCNAFAYFCRFTLREPPLRTTDPRDRLCPKKNHGQFPSEFSQLTRPSLWAGRGTITPIIATESRVRWFPLAIRPAQAVRALAILERRMAPFLRPVNSPLDTSTISGMKVNYGEKLPKTLRNSTIDLNATRSTAYAEARRIGLISLLGSASLSEFAALVTGLKLKPDPAMQLIRYRHRDFVGPHNDHHPRSRICATATSICKLHSAQPASSVNIYSMNPAATSTTSATSARPQG